MNAYQEFMERLKLFTSKNKNIVENTLSNIFTMRIIGNKTHGDLAEIGMVEFINQFMYDYHSVHVGKDKYRSKENEEDITITNEITKEEIAVSMKAYGDGPLQLSTDRNMTLFPYLSQFGSKIEDKNIINQIFHSDVFQKMMSINTMPMIYKENEKKCNILIFNFGKMVQDTVKIELIQKSGEAIGRGSKKRIHPIYAFYNAAGEYICEVRYGGPDANALQRGFWTNTVRAQSYFTSITGGWIAYEHNLDLVKLIALALNSRVAAHIQAIKIMQNDIDAVKQHVE